MTEASDDVELDLLRARVTELEGLLANATDMIVIHRDGRFTFANAAVTRVLGWEPDELVGRTVLSITHPDDHDRIARRIEDRRRGVESPGAGRYRFLCKDGTTRWVATVSTTQLDDPAVRGIVVNARDITATVEAEDALGRSEARHRALVEHLSDVIVVTDAQGTISYVTPGVERLVGWPPEVVLGQSIFVNIHPDDRERGLRTLDDAVATGPGRYGPERFRYLRADGTWCHLETSASNRLGDPDVAGLVFVLRDVTVQQETEDALRHLALHDPLTGLANRSLLIENLRAALAAGRRDGACTAVLVVDLDRFKDINDQLGHEAGDAVLEQVAERMCAVVREGDTVARSGGDEFTIVLPATSAETAVEAATRLADALRDPIEHGGEVIIAGGSVGIAIAPQHGDDPQHLFRHADAAMYRAKGTPSGVAVHASPSSDSSAV